MDKSKHDASTTAVLHRSLHDLPQQVVSADGLYLTLESGQQILDASGGAAVACLGHNNPVVKAAMVAQLDRVAYCHSLFYSTPTMEDLCHTLIEGTEGEMARAFIISSGSESIEAAMKMARQYFVELEGKTTRRARFIARRQSYHGITLGALGLGGHFARREIYEEILKGHVVSHVSPCYAYRNRQAAETEEEYGLRLARELDEEIQRLGADTVCAFVAEPVVGAALGCVPSVPGYFKAIRQVCDKHGVLLILDEIMSGMGRCGYLHAWQSPLVDVVPDLQTIGKGLGGGYAPVAAMLVGHKVADVLARGTGAFAHGQTYQGHPLACAAALSVQRVIKDNDLVTQARERGHLLGKLLKQQLGQHHHVGDIRGMGLFWAIEFVQDKSTKEPFSPKQAVGFALHERGLKPPFCLSLYPGAGTADGWKGDHLIVSPPFTSTEEDIRLIVDKMHALIVGYFSGFGGAEQREQHEKRDRENGVPVNPIQDPSEGTLAVTG